METNYDSAEKVKKLSVKGIHPGTEVTRTLLDRLCSPDKKLKIIHIAGTNGKGSTAEYFTGILVAAGKKTGTFTSPEVYCFYDQFRIDGKQIPQESMEQYFGAALKAAAGTGATSFEVQTAAAIYAFFMEGCEYAVIECGMGGLNDATNAVAKKELAVITSISLEHTAWLGDTVEKICAQKAGIIKGNCPAVGNFIQPPEAKRYLESVGVKFTDGVEYGGRQFVYRGRTYALSAEGEFQPYNAATAIEGARILGISESAVYDGIKNTLPRGRIERFEKCGKVFILDGAHNPAAFVPLAGYLKSFPPEDVTVIFGCLSDKDIEGNLSKISGAAERIIAVPCKGDRARSSQETAAACKKYFKQTDIAESVSDALRKSFTRFTAVCGSFTLLKEAKLWIENLTEKRL